MPVSIEDETDAAVDTYRCGGVVLLSVSMYRQKKCGSQVVSAKSEEVLQAKSNAFSAFWILWWWMGEKLIYGNVCSCSGKEIIRIINWSLRHMAVWIWDAHPKAIELMLTLSFANLNTFNPITARLCSTVFVVGTLLRKAESRAE